MDFQNDYYPLISVVTLTYNSLFLLETIDSVLSQNYPNIEYILIDDCSHNFNQEKIQKFIFERKRHNIKKIRIISNGANIGTVKCLNSAHKLASGKIIFNLSSGDTFSNSDVLSEWVHCFKKTNCDVSTSYRNILTDNSKSMNRKMPNERDRTAIEKLSGCKLFKYSTKFFVCLMSGSCTAITKEHLNRIGKINERIKLIEDFPISLASFRGDAKIAFFDKVTINYRDNGISTSNELSEEYVKDLDTIFYEEMLPYLKHKKIRTLKYRFYKRKMFFGRRFKLLANNVRFKKNRSFNSFFELIILIITHPISILSKCMENVLKCIFVWISK